MTSSRVMRGTKAKIFLYICGILAITGLIACYNSTLSQLEEANKSNEKCHQQQENLSAQLQVISDYKQKLEKSLKNEMAEHQQTKANLEMKIHEEKSKNDKLSSNALTKYNSLQQHFNLLQTEHNDFKDECEAGQKKRLDDISQLQDRVEKLQSQLDSALAAKEKLKTQFAQVETENLELKNALRDKPNDNEAQKTINFFTNKYHDLEEQFKALKEKCAANPPDSSPSNKPALPLLKLAEKPSSSTKSVPKLSPSEGSLNGARPLLSPSVTPETAKKVVNLKPPEGVLPVPDNRENQNEQPETAKEKAGRGQDDPEKDNAAREEFDQPQNGLGFDEFLKQGQNSEKKHVDDLNVPDNKKMRQDQEYKDLQREEEGEDDFDGYVDPARPEGAAVRN